ncbi:MAG: hypothetical protein RR543_03865 [Erysipelotrichales bacterium]
MNDNLDTLIKLIYSSNLNETKLIDQSIIDFNEFDLSSVSLRDRIKENFNIEYKFRFNEEEQTDLIHNHCIRLIEKGYNSSNAAYLFCLAAREIYIFKNKEVFVKNERAFEYVGLINKTSSIILLGAFYACEVKDIDLKKMSSATRITHHDIDHELEYGISENHMHLKGSGYSFEISVFDFFNTRLMDYEYFDRLFKNDEFTKKLKLNKTTEEIRLYFMKLKVYKLLLFLLMQHNSKVFKSISQTSRDEIYNILVKMLKSKNISTIMFYATNNDFIIFENNFLLVHSSLIDNPINGDPRCYLKNEVEFTKDVFKELLYPIENSNYSKQHNDEFMHYANKYFEGIVQLKDLLIHNNSDIGFDMFKRREDNKLQMMAEDKNNIIIYRSVFDKYYREKNIKKIEFRTTPTNKKKLLKLIEDLHNANKAVYLYNLKNKDSFIKYLEDNKDFDLENCKKSNHRGLFSYCPLDILRKYTSNSDDIYCGINSTKQIDIPDEEFNLVKKSYDEYCLRRNESKLHFIKYGFIFHYIKSNSGIFDGLEYNCKDNEIKYIGRYQDWYSTTDKIVDSFINIFDNEELTLYKDKLLAIDTANYEKFVPPEAYGRLFRKHAFLVKDEFNLNFTNHVGEDFKDLASSIRNVAETIEYCQFDIGNRLGHANSLGLDVEKFYRNKKIILTNLEHHLDNLAIMYQYIKTYDGGNKYVYNIDEEFKKYSKVFCNNYVSSNSIYNDLDFTINDYFDFLVLKSDNPKAYLMDGAGWWENNISYHNLCSRYFIEKYEFNFNSKWHKEAFQNKKARKLFYLYHYDKSYICIGKQILNFDLIDMNWFIECVKLFQRFVLQRVEDLKITIESNPASNHRITHVKKYRDLPLFNFNDIYEDNPSKFANVCINTDDSAIFENNLNNEYILVAKVLEEKGVNLYKRTQYIKYLIDKSNKATFIK